MATGRGRSEPAICTADQHLERGAGRGGGHAEGKLVTEGQLALQTRTINCILIAARRQRHFTQRRGQQGAL